MWPVNPQGWRDLVEGLVGIRPPDVAQGRKDKKPSGDSSGWLVTHFRELPEHADDQTTERYARAWLWHLVAGYLFPDGSGNRFSWLMLPYLGGDWELLGIGNRSPIIVGAV